MNVNNVKLEKTAVLPSQYPDDYKPEIAFVGRSNVGKSSFINKMINRKGLARVSGTPGKTATINFYNVEDKIYFVDLPGYGFAKVSKAEQKKWGEMIEKYLYTRGQLKLIIMIVDIRHKPSKDDILMSNWTKQLGYNKIIVATKSDKISKTQSETNVKLISEVLELEPKDRIFTFSAKTGNGKDEIWAAIEEIVINDK